MLHGNYSMITRETLDAKRAEYETEQRNVEHVLLRLQGALVAIDELLALLDQAGQDDAEAATG